MARPFELPDVLHAFDTHEDALVVMDDHRRVQYLNAAAARLLGDPDWPTDRPPQEIPDLEERCGPTVSRMLQETHDTGQDAVREWNSRRFGRPVRARTTRIPGGLTLSLRPLGAAWTERDVTAGERHRSTLLDALPQIVWTLDERGGRAHFNRRWTEYSGLPAEADEHLLGEVVHPDDLPALLAARSSGLQTGQPYGYEARFRRHDGAYRWHLVRVQPMHGGDDEPGWVGTAVDIDARRRAEREARALSAVLEERVAERTRDLEAINEELMTFAYSISHDLRTPLRHAVGFADLLKRDGTSQLSPKGQRYVDIVVSSVRKLDTLMEQLLTFSRIGRRPLTFTPVHLSRLVREVIAACAGDLSERRVEWRVDALPEVRGDGEALRLVLTHLIANALKFTRGRDVARVDVRCDETDTEWLVEVHDNGVGFDDRYVDRLFGVFQRLHTEDEFEGHGVGLALVRRVVSRHGGRTWAKSRGSDPHAGGATFGFSLPKPRLPDRSHD